MASQSNPEEQLTTQPATQSAGTARQLYDQCCSDDPHVCNAAYQRVGEYLLRMARARLHTRPNLEHLAHEATQQALMTIWEKLKKGQHPQHPDWFLSWCGSIVIHKLADELRKVGRSPVELLTDAGDETEAQYLELADPTAIAPEHYALDSESSHELLQMIQDHPRLVPNSKTVLLQGYFFDRDDSELAFLLGLAPSTIRVLRHRGLQTLRSDQEFMAKLDQLDFPLPVLHRNSSSQPAAEQVIPGRRATGFRAPLGRARQR